MEVPDDGFRTDNHRTTSSIGGKTSFICPSCVIDPSLPAEKRWALWVMLSRSHPSVPLTYAT